MSALAPRAVFVIRESDYEALVARHATRGQARFFLEMRGQKLEELEARHRRFLDALKTARAAVPATWRQALVQRPDLDRFLFADGDIVVAVGQDGLIANTAKYVRGQPVIGVNPMPDLYDGVLARFAPADVKRALPALAAKEMALERRTMVEAGLDSGETLTALNELFVGHGSHQSARYLLKADGREERQSSSGLIVASGTGATGWARSIMEATGARIAISPEERALAYFVREPFPSRATGTLLRSGKLADGALAVRSEMNTGGVIFADGMERDFLPFDWGKIATLKVSGRVLNLAKL
jgi:NAD kinase